MELSSVEDFQTRVSSKAVPNTFRTFGGKVRTFEQVGRQKLLNILKGIEFTLWKVQVRSQKKNSNDSDQIYPSTYKACIILLFLLVMYINTLSGRIKSLSISERTVGLHTSSSNSSKCRSVWEYYKPKSSDRRWNNQF